VDLRGLLHNRWVWIGGAAAAGLGLAVYVRARGKAGAPAAATAGTTQGSPAYASGSVGGFDSTGTDVAAWLGNYSGNLQHQLDAYQQQLTDSITALHAVPTAAGTGTGGTAYAAPGQDLYSIGDLNKLRALNPDLPVLWKDPTPNHPNDLTPYLAAGRTLRVS